MDHRFMITKTLLSCIICACSSSDAPCTALCALGSAFTVTVTSSATGAPVDGATVAGDPYDLQNGSCVHGQCNSPGFAGTYTVQISAPGFQQVTRTITVAQGTGGHCCPGTTTGHLDVALVPTA